MNERRWGALLLAAGRGERFGGPKQFVEVDGLPLVGWSLRALLAISEIEAVAIAVEPDALDTMRLLVTKLGGRERCVIVAGGATRMESSARALRALPGSCDAVIVHDGARPAIAAHDVRAAMVEVEPGQAAILARRVVDTIKEADETGRFVRRTPDRARLWAALTPQCAMRADYERAHARALRDDIVATDDAVLLERIGVRVVLVEASTENPKVTHPGDDERVAVLLRRLYAPAVRD